MILSGLPIFVYATHLLIVAYLTFGLNALFRPKSALSAFGFKYPTSQNKETQRLVNGLLQIYGARDIFMAIALYACTFLRLMYVTGILFLAGAAVAFVDGVVHRGALGNARGWWTFHWNGTVIQGALGAVLMGMFDWR